MHFILRIGAIITLLLGITLSSYAQGLSGIDVRTVNVDNLTDQQIRQIWEEAQSRGLSINQIEQLAVSRGMPPAEASKLVRRINQVRSGIAEDQRERPFSTRLRTSPTDADTVRARIFDEFFGVDTVGDSLMLQRTIEKLRKENLKSKIFGYELFTNKNLSFEPSLNIPTPKNYQLGPGDELIIDIWGAAQNTYTLQVTPEGMIMIQDLGPIYVNGMTIEEATNRLTNRLSEIYSGLSPDDETQKDTYMQVTLGQVRSIKVTLLGEVTQPGTYTLPSLATMFNALFAAGGPSLQGSFRSIQLIRNNQVISELDLYNFLIGGNQSGNLRLEDNDIIKINPYLNRVEVTGEVKRPGIYEVKDRETVQDLVRFTGGFTGQAYSHRLSIIGSSDRERIIRDATKDEFDSTVLENGDLVNVGKVLERFKNRVEIKGAVYREGEYELHDSTTVYSLIQRADGLRGDAFMNRGLIYRTKDDFTIESIAFDLRELINNPEVHDIKLKKEDIVRISSIFDLREEFTIDIKGAVNKPDRYEYVEDMTLEDIIFQAGGFKLDAAPYRIEVARRLDSEVTGRETARTAKIYQFTVSEDLRFDSGDADFTLKPFDIVYVYSAPNYYEQKEVKIGGEVLYPGTYTLENKSERISDLIDRAGGLTSEAYQVGATLFRRVEELQKTEVDTAGEQLQGILTEEMLQRQREKSSITQVGIDLEEVTGNPNSEFDLFLQEGDSLYIPKELQTVIVKGEVFRPTSIRFEKNKNFMDYIAAAGGLTNKAAKNKAYIVYANGEVDRTKRFLFFKNRPDVKPGATLVVPTKDLRAKLSPQERVSILSTVVSVAALVSTTIIQITR